MNTHDKIGTFDIVSHYAERIYHTILRNIKTLFLTALVISALYFLYNYTQMPPPKPTEMRTDGTRPTPVCTLDVLLAPSECDEALFLAQSAAYLETKGYINANVMLYTATKTDPPFVFANLNSGVVSGNINTYGSFAPIETGIFKNILKDRCTENPTPLVVDVGGNMGYFTTYAAKIGCRVRSYEPVPDPRRFIHVNTMINHLSSLVKIFPYAVDINRTVVGIDVNPDWGLSVINKDGALKVETVITEDIITEDVLLLKIDTEGHESKVLFGLREILKKYNVENLIVETKKKLLLNG